MESAGGRNKGSGRGRGCEPQEGGEGGTQGGCEQEGGPASERTNRGSESLEGKANWEAAETWGREDGGSEAPGRGGMVQGKQTVEKRTWQELRFIEQQGGSEEN